MMTQSGATHDRVLWVTLIVAAVALLGGGGYLVYRAVSPAKTSAVDAWEQENYPTIIELKSDAERLAIAGELPEAHEKYRQIMLLVAGRRIKDPLLFDEVEQCKTDQDRIYAVILKTMEQGVAPQVPQSAQLPDTQTSAYPSNFDSLRAASSEPTTQALAKPQAEAADTTVSNSRASAPATEPSIASSIQAGAKRKIPQLPGASDEQIGDSIRRGVDFLLANFDKNHVKRPPGAGDMSEAEFNGLNALCVFALLQSSQAIHDERLNVNGPLMKALIERMKKDTIATDAMTQAPVVYGKSLRCAALAVYNRPEDRNALKADVKWLVNVPIGGAYTYDDRFNRQPFAQPMSDANFGDASDPDSQPQVILFHGRHNPDGSEAGPIGDVMPHPRNPKDPFFPQLPRSGAKPGPPGPISSPGPGIGLPDTPARPGRYPQQRASTQPNQPQPVSTAPWDNSNSQFGLLGVWSGAESGIEIPLQYWQQVQKHWIECQLESGQWGYDALRKSPGFGMTVGGLASLFVTHDYLDTPMYIGANSAGRDPLSPALAKGLAYLEAGDNSLALIDAEIYYLGYNLFGLERVALASGYKYFGKHEWYRALTMRILPLQWPNGSWGRKDEGFDTVADTAFTLLFLSRGRHPIFMNKLKFEGHWSNRPHDLANLTKFAKRETERQLNWQVVPIDHDWRDWSDAPILYIASHEPPKLWPQDFDKLRAFALAGGLLFTHADSDSAAFNSFAEELAKRLFPEYPMRDIPADDLIFTGQFKIKPPLPALRGVHNGSRWLLVHSPKDLNTAWQTRSEKVERRNFELGLNLFVYSTGLVDLRNRLESSYIPAPTEQAASVVKLARLQYAGNWDPEPFAWQRFARWLQWETDVQLDIAPVKVEELKPDTSAIALLSGADGYSFQDADSSALRAFVESGGTLVIEACGGSEAFARSAQTMLLPKLLNGQALDDVMPSNPLLDKVTVQYRPGTSERAGAAPALKIATIGKGRVIYSAIDISSGLLGINAMGIAGYRPQTSQSIARNIILTTSPRP